jgi:hypothetical protein
MADASWFSGKVIHRDADKRGRTVTGEGAGEVVIPDDVRVSMELEGIFLPHATEHESAT